MTDEDGDRKARYLLDVETEFLTPEAEAKWNAWVAKYQRRRRMGWRGVMMLGMCLAVGMVVLILVVPMIWRIANG